MKLTKRQEARLVELLGQGMSVNETAKVTRRDRKTVRAVRDKYGIEPRNQADNARTRSQPADRPTRFLPPDESGQQPARVERTPEEAVDRALTTVTHGGGSKLAILGGVLELADAMLDSKRPASELVPARQRTIEGRGRHLPARQQRRGTTFLPGFSGEHLLTATVPQTGHGVRFLQRTHLPARRDELALDIASAQGVFAIVPGQSLVIPVAELGAPDAGMVNLPANSAGAAASIVAGEVQLERYARDEDVA